MNNLRDSELVPVGHKPLDIGGTEVEKGRRGDWFWQVLNNGETPEGSYVSVAFLIQIDKDLTLKKMPPVYARSTSQSGAKSKLFAIMGWPDVEMD